MVGHFFSFFASIVFSGKLFFAFCVFFGVLSVVPVSATVIQFPNQELAEEYVFPVFKDPQAVMNRDVTLSQRLEWRLSGALRTDEPFYSPFSFLSSVSFYWNESHGIGVSGLLFMPGLSSTGMKLRKEGVKNRKTREADYYFDANLAPHPFVAGFVNYQFSPLYGKISITKTLVFNFALYSFFGAGAVGLTHGKSALKMVPAVHFGIGQRFYFNRYFALDGGIDFLMYRGPNPILKNLKWTHAEKAPPRPDYDTFKKDIFLRFLARVGVTILL